MSLKEHQTTPNRFDAAADKLMGLESPAYADERQKNVVMEASAFGFTVGVYTMMIASVLAVAVGSLGTSLALLVLSMVPGAATTWYARRRQVDFTKLLKRDPKAHNRATLIQIVMLGCWLALGAYWNITGHSLIDLGPIWPDGMAPAGRGLVVGALVGAGAALVFGLVRTLRARGRSPQLHDDAADEPDDVFD